jgi:type I restriction enzyme, R subunit
MAGSAPSAGVLHISLSSEKLYDVFSDDKVEALKKDWKQFSELRRAVQIRYQEVVDVKEFEPKIQKLLDDHVTALPAETVVAIVNINDPEALKAVVGEGGKTDASKADRIASATKRTITERMEQDPAFYKQFSEMLEETIRDYRNKRISEKEYLNNVVDLASRMARRDLGRQMPDSIKGDDDAQAIFGIVEPIVTMAVNGSGPREEDAAEISKAIVGIIKQHHIVDVWSNEVAQNNMRNAIDDYFFDVVRDEKRINIPLDRLDDLELQIMDVARARFPG